MALLHENGSPIGISIIVRGGTGASLIAYRVPGEDRKAKTIRHTVKKENLEQIYRKVVKDYCAGNYLSETAAIILNDAYPAFVECYGDKVQGERSRNSVARELSAAIQRTISDKKLKPHEQLDAARTILEKLGLDYPLSKLNDFDN